MERRLAVMVLAALYPVGLAQPVHVSPMAGRWFPALPSQLESAVAKAWAAADARAGAIPPRSGLLALVAPHAGLEYSGQVAASAYRLIPSTQRTIIVLGFSHRVALDGVSAVDIDGIAVPGGTVPVAREVVAALGFPTLDESKVCDHSLENQIPLLRRAAPDAAIVPLYVGRLSKAQLAAAAAKLAARLHAGDVIVASSDFTHYGDAYGHKPFPNDASLRQRLRERAEEAFETIGSLEPEAFEAYLQRTGDTICGQAPIRLLMAALAAHRQPVYMATADYMTSADTPAGAKADLSVGYGALAFYPASAFSVEPADQKILLACSRATLEGKESTSSSAAPDLRQRTGAFVTIRKNKELRGCVGVLSPRTGLLATVADRTRAAANSDPRFPPLTRVDFPVSLEVSLLTPLKRIHNWRAFRIGQGAVLMLGDRGGLLLPQVAAEMQWNREQFLSGLSRKAGLAASAYRDPKARLYVFQAQVFGE